MGVAVGGTRHHSQAAEQLPLPSLQLYNWKELEDAICGKASFDIELWKRNTTYSSFSESDETIVFMWKVLEEYNDKQREAFLKFAWGRNRLPTERSWKEQMQVSINRAMPITAMAAHSELASSCFAPRCWQICRLSSSVDSFPLVSFLWAACMFRGRPHLAPAHDRRIPVSLKLKCRCTHPLKLLVNESLLPLRIAWPLTQIRYWYNVRRCVGSDTWNTRLWLCPCTIMMHYTCDCMERHSLPNTFDSCVSRKGALLLFYFEPKLIEQWARG